MKHNFEQRKQHRIDHAHQQAQKNKDKSQKLSKEASDMASAIPFGQPILIGHHSEKSDRNYRNRIHNKFGKAFEADGKAKYYEGKAEQIATNASVSSDDPQAIEKLEKELDNLIANQTFMKSANVFLRKNDKESFLQLKGGSEALWNEIKTNSWGCYSFELTNNNANIRRLRSRIEQLKQIESLHHDEVLIKGVRLILNPSANRVQLIFPQRVSKELYRKLRQSGFVFCKSEGAFQRMLKPFAVNIAKDFLQRMEQDFSTDSTFE